MDPFQYICRYMDLKKSFPYFPSPFKFIPNQESEL